MSPDTERTPGATGAVAAIEANRRGEPIRWARCRCGRVCRTLVDGEIASVWAADGRARAPWFDGMAAMYALPVNRWGYPGGLISCGPNQQPEGAGWDGTVVYVDSPRRKRASM